MSLRFYRCAPHWAVPGPRIGWAISCTLVELWPAQWLGACLAAPIVSDAAGAPQGGAAAFSGRVNVGDHILAIDGAPTKDITEDTIRRWFIGEPGTAIVLKIQDALTREVAAPPAHPSCKRTSRQGWAPRR